MTGATDTAEIPPALRDMWEKHDLAPLWESTSGQHGKGGPTKPLIWRWEECRASAEETAKVGSPQVVERRVLLMIDPTLNGQEATAGQLLSTYQILLPGERARPHRHSMDALRFPIMGSGATTYVDGKPCPMRPGDLILTPGWTWHEHVHEGEEPTIWVDILNVPLHHHIGTESFQPGPSNNVPPTWDDAMFSVPNIAPEIAPGEAAKGYSPQFRYPREDAFRAASLAPPDADGGYRVRYTNPVNGGPCMALIDCHMLRLNAGQETLPRRSSASTLYIVVEGEGQSIFEDGTTLAWKKSDVFTGPQGNASRHHAGPAGAHLVEVSDRPAYARLGLLKEEVLS